MVNRRFEVPFRGHGRHVNKFRGVWVPLDIPATYRIALAPQLEKLALGRSIPKTEPSEAVDDFKKISPLVEELFVRDAWLAKVVQLCAFHKTSDLPHELWQQHCAARFASCVPPLPLVTAMLYSYAASDSAECAKFFRRCLKDEWNMAPHFHVELWNQLLRSAGAQQDEGFVTLLLAEMLDVHADTERLEANKVVRALNAIKGKESYEYVKKYLFHFGESKTKALAIEYKKLRSDESQQLPENDAMFYHVLWHAEIRQPRTFSPRQLYFDYQPGALEKSSHSPNAKVDSVVKDKIQQWKDQGLLPEDYEHTDKVYDKGAAYKSIIRKEDWKKWPKMIKHKKYGYHGEP